MKKITAFLIALVAISVVADAQISKVVSPVDSNDVFRLDPVYAGFKRVSAKGIKTYVLNSAGVYTLDSAQIIGLKDTIKVYSNKTLIDSFRVNLEKNEKWGTQTKIFNGTTDSVVTITHGLGSIPTSISISSSSGKVESAKKAVSGTTLTLTLSPPPAADTTKVYWQVLK